MFPFLGTIRAVNNEWNCTALLIIDKVNYAYTIFSTILRNASLTYVSLHLNTDAVQLSI